MSNGVIHVGGHMGEEVVSYLKEGRSPIILFEPQILPRVTAEDVTWVQCCLGDVTGHFMLHIPRHLHDGSWDTESASMLPLLPERARYIGWTPTPTVEADVACWRFDDWATEGHRWDIAQYCDILVIDVQGMEMQVLRGFGEYLKHFREMRVEVSSPPVYFGGADAREVADYLAEQGFTTTDPIPSHGDMTFRRTG